MRKVFVRPLAMIQFLIGLLFLRASYYTLSGVLNLEFRAEMAYGITPSQLKKEKILNILFPSFIETPLLAVAAEQVKAQPLALTALATSPLKDPVIECNQLTADFIAKSRQQANFLGSLPVWFLSDLAKATSGHCIYTSMTDSKEGFAWPGRVNFLEYFKQISSEGLYKCRGAVDRNSNSLGGLSNLGWSVLTFPLESGFLTGEVLPTKKAQRFWYFNENEVWVRGFDKNKFELMFSFNSKTSTLDSKIAASLEDVIKNWYHVAPDKVEQVLRIKNPDIPSDVLADTYYQILNLQGDNKSARSYVIDNLFNLCSNQEQCLTAIRDRLKINWIEIKSTSNYLKLNEVATSREIIYKVFAEKVLASPVLSQIEMESQYECHDPPSDAESCGNFSYVVSLRNKKQQKISIGETQEDNPKVMLVDAGGDVLALIENIRADASAELIHLSFEKQKYQSIFKFPSGESPIINDLKSKYPIFSFEYYKDEQNPAHILVYQFNNRSPASQKMCFKLGIKSKPTAFDKFWTVAQNGAAYSFQDSLTDNKVDLSNEDLKYCKRAIGN